MLFFPSTSLFLTELSEKINKFLCRVLKLVKPYSGLIHVQFKSWKKFHLK